MEITLKKKTTEYFIDSFWVRRLFIVCMRVFCAQMRQFCLFTYPPISKWASRSILAHSLQHYHDFQTNVAIFASVVQAYIQSYLFGGRIKLFICQIRHELSVTIHEISTSWKKTLNGGPYIYVDNISYFGLSVCFWQMKSLNVFWCALRFSTIYRKMD